MVRFYAGSIKAPANSLIVSARKQYLNVAKNRNNTKKAIRKAIGRQLSYLKRNIKSIHSILDAYDKKQINHPLDKKQMRYFWVIQTLYEQQHQMHKTYPTA